MDWSNLPNDLLEKIADHLFSRLELIRFRSVCRSWRSSSSHKHFPTLSIQLPPLIRPRCKSFIRNTYSDELEFKKKFMGSFFLSRAKFFHIRSSSSPKGWLIKLEERSSGKLRCLYPLSDLPIYHSCESLGLLGFQVWGVSEAYMIKTAEEGRMPSGFKKVVLSPGLGDIVVFTVGWDGKLRYWDGEKEEWVKIVGQKTQYDDSIFDDIIVHRGQLYVVDIDGIVSWIDNSMNVIQYAPPVGSLLGQKNFVELHGELHVVDRLLEGRTRMGQVVDRVFIDQHSVGRRHWSNVIFLDNEGFQYHTVIRKCDSKAIGFKVYKLDEEWGRWVEVKSLSDQAFIMATDSCFSVSARDFNGCLENAIYFTDQQDRRSSSGLDGHDLSVFKLDDGSISKMAVEPSCFRLFTPSFI